MATPSPNVPRPPSVAAKPPGPAQPSAPLAAGAMQALPGDEQVVAISIWQHPFVQEVMPFLTSLLLHVTIIVVGYYTVKTVYEKVVKPAISEQVVIPEAGFQDGPEGGIPHPGLGGDATRDAAQNKIVDVPPDASGWSDKPSQNLTPALMGGGGEDSSSEGVIGTAGAGIGRAATFGKGAGLGSGDGDGSGPLAPYGVPGGGQGIGPKSNFMGVGGNARLLCYVCDASGSMVTKFDDLRSEIRKSIDRLRPTQFFNVVFFQDVARAASDVKLMPVSAENKAKVNKFLEDTSAHGQTDPIPALELAFKQKPQLIYLLTDGDFPDNEAVVKFITDRNKDKKVKINTIAYLDRGDEYEKVLKRIAAENGGVFRYVSQEDLGKK